jgi:membrane associated rhomboid family serine protease
VIPLHDLNPTRRTPFVTVFLIAACIAVYFFVQARPGGTDTVRVEGGDTVRIESSVRFSLEYAAVPCEIAQGRPLTLLEVAATFNRGDKEACQSSATGPELFAGKNVWLAVLTSIFLHGSLLHLGGNMLFLWVFGNNIEDHLGHVAYLFFYLAAGIVASIAHIAMQPDSTLPVVGASGAIAGVMGAYLVWFPRAPVTTLIILVIIPIVTTIDAAWLLAVWFVLQFFTSADSSVAWVAHVAGFVFGVALAVLVLTSQQARRVMWRSHVR